MRPLRILHVAPYHEAAWAFGGIPRVVGALARGLASRGHQVTVCATDAGTANTRLGRPTDAPGRGPWHDAGTERLHLHVFPNVSNALAYRAQLFMPLGMAGFLTEHAGTFDVAHLHACRNIPGVLAARALERAHVPYVLAPNGTAVNIERLRAAKAVFDMVAGRRVLSGARRLIAVTASERRQLLDLGIPGEQIDIVPNPVVLREFAERAPTGAFRHRLGIGREPLIVYLGRLTPRKNVDILARAFAQLGWPDARLVIAGNDMGSGPGLRSLVARLGIGDSVVFTGLVTGVSRLELLTDADVTVNASEHEIFGLVPIESLMCGAPVIVGDDSGCGEIIHSLGGGLAVRPRDVDALTGALATVLRDPTAWRMAARAAAERIADLYGAQVVCERLERVYERTTGAPQP
jgi:glycosyltransferase involved in cell wall biosynthesis